MTKIVKLTEQDLNRLVNKVLKEQEEANYMFFSNLEQIKRQCEMMLDMDPQMVDQLINNGHDWADDHITEAKVNIDQVFDFFKNEFDKEDEYVDYEEMMAESRKKTGTPLCARGKHQQRQNIRSTLVHIAMVTLFKFVKVKLRDLMAKDIVQGLIVN